MKKSVSPAMMVLAAVIVLGVIGGLYYVFVGGSSSSPSAVASPYGLPKDGEGFKTPPPGGSGINTITGEPLPASVKEKENHPFPGSTPNGTASMPSLPPGARVKP